MHEEEVVFALVQESYAAVSVQLYINILVPAKSMEMLCLVWRKL